MTAKARRTPVLRRIRRAAGELAVADYAGAEPAVVVMHGFLDRRSINEPLADHLQGRRVLLFDFLGYGDSDKPSSHTYDSVSFEADLDAVVANSVDGPIVLVGHDASGPTAINWARRNPDRVAHLVILNSYYHQTTSLRFPEVIALFANPATRALTAEVSTDRGLIVLCVLWQGAAFARQEAELRGQTDTGTAVRGAQARWLRAFPVRRLLTFVGFSPRRLGIGRRLLTAMARWRFVPTVEQIGWIEQFTDTPSTTAAFLDWTQDLNANLASNTARTGALTSLDCPVSVVFGVLDPYLSADLADELAALFPTSRVYLMDAGHWPQLQRPERVAKIVMSPHPS